MVIIDGQTIATIPRSLPMASRGRGCAGAGMVPVEAGAAQPWLDGALATNSQPEEGSGSASLPPGSLPGPTTHWRACRRCGCFEPFAGLTEECCANTSGLACSFVEGSIEDEDGHSYLQRVVIDEHLAQLQGHHEPAFPLAAEAHRGQQQQQQRPTTAESVSMRTSKVVSSTLGSSCGSGLPSTTALPGASTARHAPPFHMWRGVA